MESDNRIGLEQARQMPDKEKLRMGKPRGVAEIFACVFLIIERLALILHAQIGD